MFKVRNGDGKEFGPVDLDQIVAWAKEGRVEKDALLIPDDGGEPRSVFSEPAVAAVLGAPPTVAGPVTTSDDAPLSGIIPYKNPHALVGYYLGIFSCFPLLGLLLGPAAIVLGIVGIRRRKAEPKRRGLAHAWIAISFGIIGLAIGLLFAVLIVIAILENM